jgi:hypothetical protein
MCYSGLFSETGASNEMIKLEICERKFGKMKSRKMSLPVSNIGMKEWAVAIKALETGRLTFLLRKGGIREEGREFSLPYRGFLLYPTYEHQTKELLKKEFRDSIEMTEPIVNAVNFNSWAHIYGIAKITDWKVAKRLDPFHIWEDDYIVKKIRWKPLYPLYVIFLRVYRLANSQCIPYLKAYGGCKSWVLLETDVSLAGMIPVLDDESFSERIEEFSSILGAAGQVIDLNAKGA